MEIIRFLLIALTILSVAHGYSESEGEEDYLGQDIDPDFLLSDDEAMKIYGLSFITLILLFVYDDILNRDTSDEDEREEEGYQNMNPLHRLCKVIHNPDQINYYDENGVVQEELSNKTAYIQLGDLFYERNTITNYKSKGGTGPLYSLDSICFLLVDPSIRNASYTEYLQRVKRNNIPAISLLDRKDLLGFIINGMDSLNLQKESTVQRPNYCWKSLQDAMNKVEYDYSMEKSSFTPKFEEREKIIKPTIKTRVLEDRNSVLKCGQDLGICLEIFNECMKREREQAERERKKREEEKIKEMSSKNLSLVEQLTRANVPSSPQKRAKDMVPIIIVPASPSAIITIWNVEKFLSEGEFISTVDSKQKAKERQSFVRIEHEMEQDKRKKQPFEIIDNPIRLGMDDWSRVIGVIVQGVNWQFKGWKWESPLDLFQHVCGIYIHYEGEEIPSNVMSWNVNYIPISRNKRHLDKTAQLAFWNAIDHFITFKNGKK